MSKYSLADSLAVVLPYLSSALAAPTSVVRLQQAAQWMPPVARALLECHLSAARVDVSQGISIYAHEKHLLHRVLDSSSTWGSLRPFLEHWSDSRSLLHQHIAHLWFEFDLDESGEELPLPGVFLRLPKLPPQEMVSLVLQILADLQPDSPFHQNQHLLSYFEAVPPDAVVTYMGIMLSRPQPKLRLNIRGLKPAQVWDYLETCRWSHPPNEVVQTTLNLSKDFALTLDIAEDITSRIGFECIGGNQYHFDEGWERLVNHLVDNGLCTATQSAALRQWVGYMTPQTSMVDWPIHLILAAIAQGEDWFDVIFRKLSHLKLVYNPPHGLELKAYLEVRHQFLPRKWKGTSL